MATVKVKYRPSSSPHKEGTIFYQVIHDRKPRQISTDYRVYRSEWNDRKATLTSTATGARTPYILSVRERIKCDLERIGRVIQTLDKTQFEYSVDDIVEEYERIVTENSMLTYMEGIIAKLKYNGKVRTAEAYRSALNSFRNYREGEDLMLECLNRDIAEAYEAWLRGRGVALNTVSFYFRILRAVYNRAVEEGLTVDRNPFRKVYTGIEKTVKRALPLQMIKRIKFMDLSQQPAMEFARDMFILSFMLRGMSLVDMAFLKKKDLRDGHVIYRRRKTAQLLSIEWTPDMQAIVDRYPPNKTEFLLPIIRNPDSVAIYAYRNIGYMINRQLHQIAACLELPIPLTMYVARHSWASAAKSKGIPVSVISEGMGHDSELTTQIYLASLDTSVVDRANSILLQELKG